MFFLHDQHIDALKEDKEGCRRCHLEDQDRFSLAFLRRTEPDKTTLINLYHDNCIGCHQTRAAEKKNSGPLTCGQCHRKNATAISETDPMGFDLSLHFRHVQAADRACEVCHHEYDPNTKKVVYIKGKERSCRYCHQSQDRDTGKQFQTAGHLSCIQCHLGKIEKGLKAGPIQCRGCHGASEKRRIKTVDPVPRIDRNQPDAVFVTRFDPEKPAPATEYRMPLVAFDHLAHEKANTTCRICHHADIRPCSACHSVEGSEKGGQVNLEKAMHHPGAGQSCTGCHLRSTTQTQCRGCHAMIKTNRSKDDRYCKTCHAGAIASNEDPVAAAKDQSRAKALLEDQKAVKTRYTDKIPEAVVIGSLEDRYKPVNLPHGKIVSSLQESIKNSRLAGAFHDQGQKVCQGCHHNSPADTQPPRCGSCHGKTFDPERPLVPGLMGAFHQQCMGCHREMSLEKPVETDCNACHEEKKP